MDRYHLAWLMVGKPKGIVRGRPMDADEEAAYVREVATQKTAALRMSLDAVERQHMPFVGETGGGLGRATPRRPSAPVGDAIPRDPDRAPDRAACRRTRPSPTAWPRRAARRRASGPRGAASPPARPDAAVTAAPTLVPAVGGTRRVPAPDPIATDYLLLGLRLDQHIPGLVDGYFGPAELKARVDMEQLRAPRAAPRRRSRAGRTGPGGGRRSRIGAPG